MTDPEHTPPPSSSPGPDDADFADVVALLSQTQPALPDDLAARLEDVLASAEDAPRAVSDLAGLIERDADEAWSLAVAIFGEGAEPKTGPAWETLVEAFAGLQEELSGNPSPDQVLVRVGEVALEVASRSGHEIAPAGLLRAEERVALLLRGGLQLQSGSDPRSSSVASDPRGLLSGELGPRLVGAYPQSGSDELRTLIARELLGELSSADTSRLDELRKDQALEAALIEEHYREVTEVPPGVCVRRDELAAAVSAWVSPPKRAASPAPPPAVTREPRSLEQRPPVRASAPRASAPRLGLGRRLFRASRRNAPVLVLSGAMSLVLSGAIGLVVWKSQAADQRRLEVAGQIEWETFQDRFQKELGAAEERVREAHERLEAGQAGDALSSLASAERSLKELVELESEFCIQTPPARLRIYAQEFRGVSDALWRQLLLDRSRALETFGAESYSAALAAVAQGLEAHCEAPGEGELGRSGRSHAEALASFAEERVALRIQRGRVEALLGRSEEALETFAAVLRDRPNSVAAHLELGRVQDQCGVYLAALAAFDKAIELDAKSLPAYLSRGETYLTLRLPERAAQDFQQAIELDDSSFEGYLLLGRAQCAAGAFGEAQDSLTEAIDIMPSLPEGYLERGRLHLAARRMSQARKDFEVAIARSAECYEAYLGLGQACEWLQDEEAAAKAYQSVLDNKVAAGRKVWAQGKAAMGQLELSLADPLVAGAEFELAYRMRDVDSRGQPGAFPSLTRLRTGREELRRKRVSAAREHLDAALQAEPTLLAARLGRARLAFREGDLEVLGTELEAVEKILAAVPRLEPSQDEASNSDEEAWDDEGEASAPERRRLIEAEALALQGLWAAGVGRADEARKKLQAALAADPQSALAKAGLAGLVLEEDRPRARTLFAEARAAQALMSDESGFSFNEGLRQANYARKTKDREQLAQARRAFARARLTNPLHARSYLEEGRLCAEWPAYDAALDCFEAAIRCDPFLWEAHHERGLLLSRDLPLKRDLVTERPAQVRDPVLGRAAFDAALAIAPKGQRGEPYYGRALAAIALAGQGQREELEVARRDLQAAIEEIPKDLTRAEPTVFLRARTYLRAQAQVADALGDRDHRTQVSARLERVEAQAKAIVAREVQAALNLRDRLNYSDAIKRLDQAIALDPRHSEAIYARGTCYLKIGNFVPGILDFSRALELDPRIADQVYNKVYQISYVVDLNRVITELNKIVADHPNKSYVVFLRGFFYVAKTEFKQVGEEDILLGIADFNRCLELNPDHVTAYLYRGSLLSLLGERRGEPQPKAPAKDEWDLDEDPSVDLLDSRAKCYQRALSDYAEALKRDPESGIAHYLRAVLWARRAQEPGLDPAEVQARKETALESLRASFESEFKGYERVRNEKAFDSIRNLPEFKELMRGN